MNRRVPLLFVVAAAAAAAAGTGSYWHMAPIWNPPLLTETTTCLM
jgi:hypothetical protein